MCGSDFHRSRFGPCRGEYSVGSRWSPGCLLKCGTRDCKWERDWWPAAGLGWLVTLELTSGSHPERITKSKDPYPQNGGAACRYKGPRMAARRCRRGSGPSTPSPLRQRRGDLAQDDSADKSQNSRRLSLPNAKFGGQECPPPPRRT